jgi:hypothetical protein
MLLFANLSTDAELEPDLLAKKLLPPFCPGDLELDLIGYICPFFN